MRIGINTRFLLANKMEGFGWFTYEITKRLVLNHPEHTFYFFFDRPFDAKFIFADNVVPIVLSPQARHPILFRIWFNYSITKALKKYQIDVFFSPDGYLSLRTDVRQIGVIHDLNFEHFPEDIPSAPRKYLKKYFPLFAKKADKIVTVSHYSKQDIVEKYHVEEEKIEVVYNAASPYFKVQTGEVIEKVKQQFTGGAPFLVYVGAIHPRKNIDRLVKAFQLFKQENKSELKLLVVGEKLWSNGKDADKEDEEVLFTGHVNIVVLAEIVGAAQALCLVSYFEGFGIPLVEAMQSGVPVLSGNLTSLPEVCGEAAVYVDPFDVESIKDGMDRIVNDADLRDKNKILGLQQAQKFNWDTSAEQIWSMLIG
ncbi:glycosyltransferase family 1 protein [Putridiphycobacter roseus]|uniref:Glycosyltransferase family 1 protein n=1 Tax=Putridiphycobacter roseus TaxID=2219161 RepID=A0A2W1N5S7_9FLAO|nr:glycosyltransferase family 1 protein [Putridiphycobacter roseus]PZE18501.1 glycosyltransferase family 1 protein [Putridiphycobacter roseus]